MNKMAIEVAIQIRIRINIINIITAAMRIIIPDKHGYQTGEL